MNNKTSFLKSRKSIRLPHYDYAQEGMYFITLCSHQSKPIFGELSDDTVRLNRLGEAVQQSWNNLPKHFPNIAIDIFVIMPNHIHGIITILERQPNGKSCPSGTSGTLGSIVRCLKACVTKWARKNTDIYPVWQGNYYEHVIRDEKDYQRIAEYIEYNPLRRVHDDVYRHG